MDKQIENYQIDYQLLVQSIQYETGLDKDEVVQALNTVPEIIADLLELGEVRIERLMKIAIKDKRLDVVLELVV